MGTTFEIELNGDNLDRAADLAFAEAHRLDRMLSNYIPDSELSRVNAHAADGPLKVSPELFALLVECREYYRESEGTFDISVGPLMEIWGFYKGSGRLPQREEVERAIEQVGWNNIELDASRCAVRFKRRGVNLDPGGVGKGYAVDRMADVLRREGIRSGFISGGGSSIYAIGAPPEDGRGWHVPVRDPKDENKTVAAVFLKDESLSTSGNYEKFFWAEGRLYSHIMDPRTGYPAQGMLAVSVIAPKTLDSEVWTKPYYILGREWAARHKQKDFRVLLCPDKPEATCAWLP